MILNKRKKRLVTTLLSLSILFVLLGVIAPSTEQLYGSFLILLLVWSSVYNIFLLISSSFTKGKEPRLLKSTAAIVASSVMIILMFSAIGDVSVFDMVIILLLMISGLFYMRRTWSI